MNYTPPDKLEANPRKGLTVPVLLHWVLTYTKCATCDGSLSDGFDDDHIKPLWMGGTNAPDNRQPLCKPCHKVKTALESKARAKADRMSGRKGQANRRSKRGGSSIKPHVNGLQSAGFQKRPEGHSAWGRGGGNVRYDD